jgi:hypothetical protein
VRRRGLAAVPTTGCTSRPAAFIFTTTTRPGFALGFFIFNGGYFHMVDFNQKAARKFCRYTRCRMKLPEPTTNLHEAFCKRGCYDSFHLKICRVCEKPPNRSTARLSRRRKATRSSL